MHTFRRRPNGDGFEVGVWVPDWDQATRSSDGARGLVPSARFVIVLQVKFFRSAVRMVNLLNGGTGNTDPIIERASIVEETDGEVDAGKAESAPVVRGPRARAAGNSVV